MNDDHERQQLLGDLENFAVAGKLRLVWDPDKAGRWVADGQAADRLSDAKKLVSLDLQMTPRSDGGFLVFGLDEVFNARELNRLREHFEERTFPPFVKEVTGWLRQGFLKIDTSDTRPVLIAKGREAAYLREHGIRVVERLGQVRGEQVDMSQLRAAMGECWPAFEERLDELLEQRGRGR